MYVLVLIQVFYVNLTTGEVKWGDDATKDGTLPVDDEGEEYYQQLGEETAEAWYSENKEDQKQHDGRGASHWESYVDDSSGYTFYRNVDTGKCQWEMPSELYENTDGDTNKTTDHKSGNRCVSIECLILPLQCLNPSMIPVLLFTKKRKKEINKKSHHFLYFSLGTLFF